MQGNPDWLQKLKTKRDYYKDWLSRFKSLGDIANEVQKNLELIKWQIQAIESRPSESIEIPMPDLSETLDSDLSHIQKALPLIPKIDNSLITSATSFTSTGAFSIAEFASRVRHLDAPDAVDYSDRVRYTLKGLHQKHDKPREVREILNKLENPNTIQRLDKALDAYQAYNRGTSQRSAAAFAYRTLLDGVKGDLWELARKYTSVKMNWELMASVLAQGEPNGPQFQELVALTNRFSGFIARLSDIGKAREGGAATDLDNIWTETQDYIVALIG